METAHYIFKVGKRHSKTTLMLLNTADVKKNKAFLNKHLGAIKGVPGLQKARNVVAVGNDCITYSTVAKMPSKFSRFSAVRSVRVTADDNLSEFV